MKLSPVSENAVLITLGDEISEALTPQILTLKALVEDDLGDVLLDIIPSYTTLLVIYDLHLLTLEAARARLRQCLARLNDALTQAAEGRQVDIPVWYDSAVGYDLETLARDINLSVDEAIRLHTGKTYQVFALGFNPGFGFLVKVDKRLVSPRHATPREQVAAGSVGIADAQTAVYPKASPGGWQIIGRSPTRLFDPDKPLDEAALLRVGDRVRFRAVSRDEFVALGGTV